MTTSSHNAPFNIAIETSGRLGSVALGRGPELLETRSFGVHLRHAVELLPTIDSICRAKGVTPCLIGECYVSSGPGSFTGVRIGITAARSMARFGGVRVVGVPTLDVIAQNVLDLDEPPASVGVILDAKRQRVYAAAYVREQGAYVCTVPAAERDPAEFFKQLPEFSALTGEGVEYFGDAVRQSGLTVVPESARMPRAEVVHQLGHSRAARGEFDDPGQLLPVYVRLPEAEEVWRRRRQT